MEVVIYWVSDSANTTIDKRIKAVKGAICEILALAADLKSAYIGPVSTALELWESLIISKLTTNAATWIQLSKKSVQKLDKLQTDFLKRLLGLPKTAPNVGVLWESGCMPMSWRVRLEKLKSIQHLEWQSNESLAVKMWRLENELNIPGLKSEIEAVCEKYKLPLPSKQIPRKLYNNMIKVAVTEEARLELQERVLNSPKLKHLAGWTTPRANYVTMTNLTRIQFLARCRLSCLFEFQGDFGGGKLCPCGSRDTLQHVRDNCPHYIDLRPSSMEEVEAVERSEDFYRKVIERHRMLNESGLHAAVQPPPPLPPASTSPTPTPAPLPPPPTPSPSTRPCPARSPHGGGGCGTGPGAKVPYQTS